MNTHDPAWQQFDAVSALAQSGKWHEAIPQYEALAQRELPSDLRAHLCNDVGVAYQSTGELDKALDSFRQSWEIYERDKNKLGAAIALGNLGTVHTQRREWANAVQRFDRSLLVFENLEIDNLAVAKLRVDMGDSLVATGKPRAACEQYELALARQEAEGDKHGQAVTLHALGTALRARSRWEDGITAFEHSIALFEELDDAQSLATTLNRLGELQYDRHDYENAVETFRRDLKLSESLKNPKAVAQAVNNVGLAHLGLKNFEQAAAQFRRAIPLWEKLGDEFGLALSLWGHAQLLYEQDSGAEAQEEGWRAHAILERLHRPEEADVRKWLAAIRRGKRTGIRRYI
jgi:tetratricopeptide (TPR) repeat protein